MEDNSQLNQRIGMLERQVEEMKIELAKKEDRPNMKKKYITWLIMGIFIIGFYSAYYFYIMSLF